MSNDNSVTIIGTLTRDPELRFTPTGKSVVKLGVARNTRVREGNEWVDGEAQYYDVTAWGTLADNIAESLNKGMRVVVFGELDYQSWENDQGEKRNKVEIKAESVAPDLRWATAQVTKVSSNNGGSSRSSGGSSQRRETPADNPFG